MQRRVWFALFIILLLSLIGDATLQTRNYIETVQTVNICTGTYSSTTCLGSASCPAITGATISSSSCDYKNDAGTSTACFSPGDKICKYSKSCTDTCDTATYVNSCASSTSVKTCSNPVAYSSCTAQDISCTSYDIPCYSETTTSCGSLSCSGTGYVDTCEGFTFVDYPANTVSTCSNGQCATLSTNNCGIPTRSIVKSKCGVQCITDTDCPNSGDKCSPTLYQCYNPTDFNFFISTRRCSIDADCDSINNNPGYYKCNTASQICYRASDGVPYNSGCTDNLKLPFDITKCFSPETLLRSCSVDVNTPGRYGSCFYCKDSDGDFVNIDGTCKDITGSYADTADLEYSCGSDGTCKSRVASVSCEPYADGTGRIKGDLNKDAAVNAVDQQRMTNIILGSLKIKGDICCADLNSDTLVDAIDQQRMTNMVLGSLPIDERCVVIPTATCADGIKNQDETGVDCGGVCSTCPPISSCTDGIKNQDETDIDCGGITCGKCGDLKKCTVSTDCASGKCELDSVSTVNICKPAAVCYTSKVGWKVFDGLGNLRGEVYQQYNENSVAVGSLQDPNGLDKGLDGDIDVYFTDKLDMIIETTGCDVTQQQLFAASVTRNDPLVDTVIDPNLGFLADTTVPTTTNRLKKRWDGFNTNTQVQTGNKFYFKVNPDSPPIEVIQAVCGDNFVDTGAGEECDGTDLAGATCASLGFTGSTDLPGCSPPLDTNECKYDKNVCIVVPPTVSQQCTDAINNHQGAWVTYGDCIDGQKSPTGCNYPPTECSAEDITIGNLLANKNLLCPTTQRLCANIEAPFPIYSGLNMLITILLLLGYYALRKRF